MPPIKIPEEWEQVGSKLNLLSLHVLRQSGSSRSSLLILILDLNYGLQ